MPPDAKGTYSVGIEGYQNVALLPGTTREVVVRNAGANKVMSFSVDGTQVAGRRKVVDPAKCAACHAAGLSFHGENRNTIEMCVLCHNPVTTDVARRPEAARPADTIDFRTMIHKIHTGENLTRDYTLYGFGGAKYDFTEVRYPGDRRNCNACHLPNTQQVPLKEGLASVVTPRGLLPSVGPETASCVSCHDSRQALAHAAQNVNALGESCSVCHGTAANASVNRAHAR